MCSSKTTRSPRLLRRPALQPLRGGRAGRSRRRPPWCPTIPEPFTYRMKTKLLGPPLHSERLEHETLGKPTALAVFASDSLSSCAYATEEILARARAGRRPRRVLARHADHDRAARRPRLPDPLVPPDDQGLPVGGRRLHRHPRQLRPAAGPGGRRRAAHRLRPHGRRVGRRRQRRAGIGVSRRWPRTSTWIAIVFVVVIALRQPARHQGVGQALRRADLLLHRQHGGAPRHRHRPMVFTGTLPVQTEPNIDGMLVQTQSHGDARLHGRRPADRVSRPSPPAAPPSPASRRSPTACPRSGRRRGRTPATTLVIMGALLGVMFLGLSLLAARDPRHAVRRRHADGDLPGRQVGVRRDAARPRHVLRRCRPARC